MDIATKPVFIGFDRFVWCSCFWAATGRGRENVALEPAGKGSLLLEPPAWPKLPLESRTCSLLYSFGGGNSVDVGLFPEFGMRFAGRLVVAMASSWSIPASLKLPEKLN